VTCCRQSISCASARIVEIDGGDELADSVSASGLANCEASTRHSTIDLPTHFEQAIELVTARVQLCVVAPFHGQSQ
jgi:hypothetical protein